MTAFLWFGAAAMAVVIGLLIFRDIRFRTSGPRIHAIARVTGHRENSDSDGDKSYFSRLTFTDDRLATREISSFSASRIPVPIGTEVPIHYPRGRSDLAREQDGGCGSVIAYAVVTTMLIAFATAALLGFGTAFD